MNELADPEPLEAPLSEILAGLGADLAALAQVADSLQGIVGILVRNASPTVDSAAVEQVQRLDFLVQRLFAMSAQVDDLAAGAESNWIHRGLQRTPSGECELF